MGPWTAEEVAKLRVLHLDPQKNHPVKLAGLIRHFQNNGTLWGVTQGREEPQVSNGLGRKVRDLSRVGQLDWVMARTDGTTQVRREHAERGVPAGLRREAYKRHYDDLLDAASQVWDAVVGGYEVGPASGMDRRTEMLMGALREHIPESLLWGAWDESKNLARQWQRDTKPKVHAGLGKLLDDSLAPGARFANREGFLSSLWFAVQTLANNWPLAHMEYHLEKTAEGPVLRWGAFGLSKPLPDDSDHADAVKEQHERLLREATVQELVGEMRELRRKWAQARDSIHEEVTVLRLGHLVPGHCKLCPQ